MREKRITNDAKIFTDSDTNYLNERSKSTMTKRFNDSNTDSLNEKGMNLSHDQKIH